MIERYSFLYDYAEGCHPEILETLAEDNVAQTTAYGEDRFSDAAKALIRARMGRDLPVYFVSGGTQANIIITAKALQAHEAIIAAETGHIVAHETGAMEAVGHRVITCPTPDGKLTPELIEAAVEANSFAPHNAKPRLVYISNATERGTVYTKAELTAISKLCRAQDLLLLLDGARLAVAINSSASDLTMTDIADLTDVFWIGGTKAGALIGEAIVIPNADMARDFQYVIKQRGGLLAKGRLLGQQFLSLFRDGLFDRGAEHANAMAARISDAVTEAGYALAAPTQINQIFPILPNDLIVELEKDFVFYVWAKHDAGHSVLRLTTSWATDTAQAEALIRKIKGAK